MNAKTPKTWWLIGAGLPLLAAAVLALPGCQEAPAQVSAPVKHPEVSFSYPVEQEVVDYEEFIGRVDAVNKVAISAMVTGYLHEIKFKDGENVVKDQILFEIDPSVYEAKVHLSQAMVEQAKAHWKRLQKDSDRNQALNSRKVVSDEDFNKINGDLLEGKAAVGMAEAQLEQDTVNYDYTKVRSPITGRVSRRLIDRGNMVKANETMLTWVYQIDPMYGYFDVDERTCIKLRRLVNEGKIKTYREGRMEVDVGLADEEGYSLKGTIDWVDNVLDSGTGTLKIRCVINQPKDKSGAPLILVSPGLFVRVKLPTSVPHKAILIAEKALGTDQDEKFVFVVNNQNKIERRNVTLGQRQNVNVGKMQYSLKAVEKNAPDKGKDLLVTDRVVMSGLQRVSLGTEVEARLAPMPGGAVLPPGMFTEHIGASANDKGN